MVMFPDGFKFKTFENRTRMTCEEAEREISNTHGCVSHLLGNTDGTYSVFSHTKEVKCDYCLGEVSLIHPAREVKVFRDSPDVLNKKARF